MGDIEKPKTHFVSKAAAPETWYIKFLRPVWKKPHNDNHGLIDLVDDSSLIIKRGNLVVENIYKCKPYALSRFETLPKFAIIPIEMSAGASPKPEASLLRAFSKSTSYIHPDEVNEIMNPKHGRRKSFSFFSFSSLGRLCNVAGEDSSSSLARQPPKHTKGSRSEPASRSSAWFLLRCVASLSSRSRRSRQGSMEHLKKADATDDSSCTEITVTEPVDDAAVTAAAPLKYESWAGDDPKVWSMDLTAYGEVVKCLVEDGPQSTLSDMPPNLKASTRSDMISETETDDAPMIREDEFEEFDAPGTASWSLSVSSSREFWRKEKKIIPECTSNALVPYSGELDSVDIGNISDSQSLLRAKVFGAEMFRKQCQLEKRREEETKKLLFSLDEALDQYNHKRMTTECNSSEEPEDESKCESPNYELFNSPVFESFLESSTKAWETDSRTLRLLDCKPAPISEPGIRELHCVTVQPPNLIMDTRKPKRSLSVCEDRIHHPQGEEHMILNLARLQIDELNSRKKRTNFNAKTPRSRGYKQQRSLQNGAESSSVSPRPPIPTGNVIKESVAVVVESSYDPYADFRESMIDMIVDQNIQQTSDLEELLQCYLALNEPDYHQVIIEVFSDVWHELFHKKP